MSRCCNITSNPINGFLWQTTAEEITKREIWSFLNGYLDPAIDGPNIFIDDVLTLTNLDTFGADVFVPALRLSNHAHAGGTGIGSGNTYSFWLSIPQGAPPPVVKVGFTFDVNEASDVTMQNDGSYASNENYCIEGEISPGDPDDWIRVIYNASINLTNEAEMAPTTLFSDPLVTIQSTFDTWAKLIFTDGITTNVVDNGGSFTFSIQNIPYQFTTPGCSLDVYRAPAYAVYDNWILNDTACP